MVAPFPPHLYLRLTIWFFRAPRWAIMGLMTSSSLITEEYRSLLAGIRERIRSAQHKALRAVNRELVDLYWDIGRMIVEQQRDEAWGRSVVERLAKDLQAEFPGVSGYSAANLWRMRNFYLN